MNESISNVCEKVKRMYRTKIRLKTCTFKHDDRLSPCSNHQDINIDLNFVLFTSRCLTK